MNGGFPAARATRRPKRVARAAAVLFSCSVLLVICAPLRAQQRPAGGSPARTMSAQAEAPINLSGYWVSIITSNDWLFRMVVPQRGQYTGVPINGRARAFADAWRAAPDQAAGKQCEAYGAAAIMQVPEHLHITWQDANTLKVQTDAGMQTRWLRFHPAAAQRAVPASRQGVSVARWMMYHGSRNVQRTAVIPPHGQAAAGALPGSPPAVPRYGWLQVRTTDMLPGLLRKNGVPYSGQARMTENWVMNSEPDGDQWLTVTTILTDPVYLSVPYVFNSIFKKEPNASGWAPGPCSLS